VLASIVDSDHPQRLHSLGERFVRDCHCFDCEFSTMAKTVLFATYDENAASLTTSLRSRRSRHPSEYVTAPAVPEPTWLASSRSRSHWIGFRVPMLVISPFSRGGFVSSALFDHTSVLRFLETRFGAEVPNLSAWRRATVGDLTSAFNFAKPDQSIPALPSTLPAIRRYLRSAQPA